MEGRRFLNSALRMVQGTWEEDWRTAAGRAYYALLHEAHVLLLRWGFSPGPREDIHRFARLHLLYGTTRLVKDVGQRIERLHKLRTQADYQLGVVGPFMTAVAAQQAVDAARDGIAELDRLDADPGLRAAAVAAIQAGRPQPPTP